MRVQSLYPIANPSQVVTKCMLTICYNLNCNRIFV
nr:MAG TPA: hypothetical protein [Caudoviricetes sp.]